MKKIKSILLPGDKKIPMIINNRINFYFYIGIATLVLGLIISFGVRSIKLMPLFLGVAVTFMLLGYTQKLKLSKKGIEIIEGICVQIDMGKIPNLEWNGVIPHKKPRRYLVQEDGGNIVFSVPYTSAFPGMAVGNKYRIYIDADATFYDFNGVTSISNVLGYEFIG